MEHLALTQMAALAHDQRLAVFRLLMRRHPDHVPAGELSDALGIKPSTLSTYLAVLTQSGLTTQTRNGTSILYAVHLNAVQTFIAFLIQDCCLGRVETCFASPIDNAVQTQRKFNVLFICSGNSARSIIAETIMRDLAGDRFNAFSAGTKPFSELNPFALQILQDKGHNTAGLKSKNIAEFTAPDGPVMDFVFTVCDTAANEYCHSWPGTYFSGHWGLPDPVKSTGTNAEKSLAFQATYGALHSRISAFANLPFASLERIALQRAIDEIAQDITNKG